MNQRYPGNAATGRRIVETDLVSKSLASAAGRAGRKIKNNRGKAGFAGGVGAATWRDHNTGGKDTRERFRSNLTEDAAMGMWNSDERGDKFMLAHERDRARYRNGNRVAKRERTFDAEDKRMRRTGMATGALGAAGLALGARGGKGIAAFNRTSWKAASNLPKSEIKAAPRTKRGQLKAEGNRVYGAKGRDLAQVAGGAALGGAAYDIERGQRGNRGRRYS